VRAAEQFSGRQKQLFLGEALGKVVKLEAHQQRPATLRTSLQSGQSRARPQSPLTPELKGFIDRVVVPILVRDYLSSIDHKKQIADGHEGVASCESMAVSQDVEVVR